MSDRRLELETRAAQRLKEQLIATYGEDSDLLRDMVEAETGLHEAIGRATLELAAVEGEKEGIEIAIAKLKERLTRHCHRAIGIREAIFSAMEIAELTSLKTPAATLSVRPSPPRVEITDEAAIPALFKVQPPPTIDKKSISAALKAGEAVDGATLSNSPPALSVRFV
jgi:hypothetical protein